MSVDIASLVFEIDSRQAEAAEQRLEKLIKTSDRLDASARRVKTATEMAGIGLSGQATATTKAVKSAGELAAAEGAVEKATRGASKAAADSRAARALEAAAMRELVFATKAYARDQAAAAKVAAAAARDQAQAIASLEARIFALKSSIDPAFAAQSRLDAEMREATALYKMGAISASDYAKATAMLDERMAAAARGQTNLNGVMIRGATNTKAMTQAGLNLSRQFADVAVTGAMGMAPLMILIQQGPQIADAFAQAKSQGLGFSAVMKGLATSLWAVLAPLLPFIIAAGAVAAVLGTGLLLATRSINKEHKDFAKTLGLTHDQLERVKNKGITTGDVLKGTFNYLAKGAGAAFKPIIDWFGRLFDAIAHGMVATIKGLVGGFLGAFGAIKATWAMLPAAIADVTITAVNATLSAVERMINLLSVQINKLLEKANAASKAAGMTMQLPMLGQVSLGQIANPSAGAASKTGSTAAAAFAKGRAEGDKIVNGVLGGIEASILDAAKKRILKQAGKAPKGAATPRDQTDERDAQIDAMLAQARADELQARIALTRDVRLRADLEKQVLGEELAKQRADLAKRAADIADDKGLTAAKKAELTGQLRAVGAIEVRTSALKALAIDEAATQALAKEALDRQTAALDVRIGLLESEGAVAKYAFERREIDLRILKLEQQRERQALEAVTIASGATATDVAIAQAKLAVLGRIQANEIEAQTGGLQGAFNNVSGALNDMASAFRDRNWATVVNSFIEAIGSIKAAFGANGTAAGKVGAAAGVAQAAGSAIGGTAGATLGGAAGGAMAGFTVAGPVGAAIGAVIGGIAGFLSSSSAKKKAKAEAAEQARQAELDRLARVAAQHRELEIRIMEMEGKTVEALAARRADELAAMDASNQALQQQIYALEDQATAAAKATAAAEAAAAVALERRGLEIQLMEATGDAAGALAAKRTDELAALNESNRAVQTAIYAAQDLALVQQAAAQTRADAQAVTDGARGDLIEAYNREAAVHREAIDRFKQIVEGLKAFSRELSFGSSAGLSPLAQYARTKAEFERLNALPAGNTERLASLQGVGQAFIEASKAASPTQLAFNRDLQAVRRAVEVSQMAAQDQVDAETQQLVALTSMVSQLVMLNQGVLSVVQAINALNVALAAERAAGGNPTSPANDNLPGSIQQYIADNKDLRRNWDAGGSLRGAGATLEEAARAHYQTTGQYEIAAGLRKFATGGDFMVGGSGGTDSQHVQFMASPDETVSIRRPGQGGGGSSELLAEVRALRETVASQGSELRRIAHSTDQTQSKLKDFDGKGLYVRGAAPDEPVLTAAA